MAIKRGTSSGVPQKILSAATEVIMEKGYAETSLRDIAVKAGVAVGQIHYYFQSRDEVMREAFLRVFMSYLETWESKIEELPTTEARVAYYIEHLQELLVHNPGVIRMYLDYVTAGMWHEDVKMLMRDCRMRLLQMIERCGPRRTDGTLIWDEAAARVVLGGADGLYLQFLLWHDTPNVDAVTVAMGRLKEFAIAVAHYDLQHATEEAPPLP